MTQNKAILAALKAGKELTNESARELCGTERLGGRIYDLRQLGYNIVGFWREGTNRYGNKSRWKAYRLVKETLNEE